MSYPEKFSLSTADICDQLRGHISTKSNWIWNSMYQKQYESAKSIIKKDTSMNSRVKKKNYT